MGKDDAQRGLLVHLALRNSDTDPSPIPSQAKYASTKNHEQYRTHN